MRTRTIFEGERGLIGTIGLLSLVANLLILTAPLYMLQIFERVLGSGSHETLVMLTAAALFALFVHFLVEWSRQRLANRLGARIEERVGPLLLGSLLGGRDRLAARDAEPLRDLQDVRVFVTGPAFTALLDAPWALLFVGVLFLFHPLIGLVSALGIGILVVLAIASDLGSRPANRLSLAASRIATGAAEDFLRQADPARAMGRVPALVARWQRLAGVAGAAGLRAGDRIALMSALAKFVRMALQIAVLGVGVALVLAHEVAPGVMIAASILLGRAAAPVEQAIGGWRQMTQARLARQRLDALLAALDDRAGRLELPPPLGRLSVENATLVVPGRQEPLLFDVSLDLRPGETLGLIGPSGAGKSTLARAIVGLQPLSRGHVRVDEAALADWPPGQLAAHVGYMPQEVELFDGTIAENIAGMDAAVPAAAIVEAAKLAEVHEMILGLPGGYNAPVGPRGSLLSAGQRQRIGLARTVVGDRRIVVLDEPNASLDPEGEAALARTVRRLGDRGTVAVVVSHRMNILATVSKIAFLQDGRLVRFGPAREVLSEIGRPVAVKPEAGPAPARSGRLAAAGSEGERP